MSCRIESKGEVKAAALRELFSGFVRGNRFVPSVTEEEAGNGHFLHEGPTVKLSKSSDSRMDPAIPAGGAAPDPLAEKIKSQLLPQLARSMRRGPAATQAAASIAAQLVAAARKEGPLDLSGIAGQAVNVVAQMPAAVWELMGAGKSSVILSAQLTEALVDSPEETLREGIRTLRGPVALTLTNPPPDRRIDLIEMTGPGGVATVHLDFLGEASVVELHVAEGTKVAANASGVAAAKSRVTFHRQGQPPEVKTLRGLVYQSSPDPGLDADVALNLNAAAKFDDEEAIVCRDLALFWHALRQAWRASGAGRFSYGALAAAGAIRAGIAQDVPARCMRVHEDGAYALCASVNFGVLLEEQFRSMQAGDTVSLILDTDNHALACELKRKSVGGQDEYAIAFYDPNTTVRHARLVVDDPADLAGKTLEHWLSADSMDQYFEGPQRILSVYKLDGNGAVPAASDADLIRHVPPDARTDPHILGRALQEGRVAFVKSCLEHMEAEFAAGRIDGETLARHVSTVIDKATGIQRGLYLGRTAAVDEYLTWLFDRGARLLSPDECFALLQPGDPKDPGVLAFAGEANRAETVALFVTRVLAAGPQALRPEHKQQLLLASWEGGEPMLHRLAAKPPDPGCGPQRERTVFEYVRVIAASTLREKEKAELCAALHGEPPTTAAQAALREGRPALAAAMAEAIAGSSCDAREASVLFTSLGVSAVDLLDALASAADAGALQTTLRSLHRWGLPDADTTALRARFGGLQVLVF